MTNPLEIRVLGPFEVRAGGRAADVGGSKRQALLAMLALREGRAISVDALVDGLWGEDVPSAPRNALHHHVARLRAELGADAIVGSTDGYALGAATVDALQFEELLEEARAALRDGDPRAAGRSVESALALWRGAALQGLAATDWFAAEARRLETLRLDALEQRFDVALALGDHADVVAAVRQALEESPFRERLWGQLMLALYRSGRQADALEAFQEAWRVLDEELGLEPGPELRRLQDAILAHDPGIAAPAAAAARRGNLPASATSFVGREDELARLLELLREHRLVTLVGPPGVGKSRLALEAGRALDVAGGVWLVELAGSGGPDAVARLLADALDVRGADPLARVASRLRDSDAVVILDACEHGLEGATRVTSTLLAECPAVRVLATSREVLHLPGEARQRVDPLGDDAAALFLERARAARPGFEPDEDDAALAAEIARRVEGLPLAIELVAARTNVLGLGELVSVLDRRLAMLEEGAPPNPVGSALGELVGWSYDLLHTDEKTLLQQLAVHRGGASLPSLVAAGVRHGLDEATVTYLLGALVDKSVVSVSFPGGDSRYDLLDTIREYVLGQLAAAGALDSTRTGHAEYFAELADAARSGLRGSGWRRWRNRLALETQNLWAALDYARDAPDPGVAVRLGTLGWFFALVERVSEGRRFLDQAREATGDEGPVDMRVELLAALSYLATEEHDLDAALEAGEAGLRLAETGAPPSQLGFAQMTLGLAAAQAGDPARGMALSSDAAATLEAAGDHWTAGANGLMFVTALALAGDVPGVVAAAASVRRHAEALDYEPWLGPVLLVEGWLAEHAGDAAAARERYERAVEAGRRIGFDDHAAYALARLAAMALDAGDATGARELLQQALELADAADAQWAGAYARSTLARVLAAEGDAPGAERLFREVLAWSQSRRPHQAREILTVALGGNPGDAAAAGLEALAALT